MSPSCPAREEREKFIRAKYVDKELLAYLPADRERAYQKWAGDEVWEGLNEMGFSLTMWEYSVGRQGRMNIFVTFMNHVVE